LLNRKSKRIIQNIFRDINKPKMFILLTFSALLALLIEKSGKTGKIVVDTEYQGYDKFIEKHTMEFCKTLKIKKTINLDFKQIGKTSKSHDLASKVAHGKRKPNSQIKLEEILELLFPNKKAPRTT